LDFTMPPLSCQIDVTGMNRNGAYFNFDYKQVDALLGRTDWHNEKFDANGRKIVLWRDPKIHGGSGRYDPYESRRNGDWKTGDTIQLEGVCSRQCTIDVLSTDHRHTNGGKYFNFDITALDAILGRTTWHGEKLKVGNDKTVIVWRNPNGGSKGDAHGRYDPFSTAKDGDWAVGDQITFADCPNRLGLWRRGSAGATCDQTCDSNALSHHEPLCYCAPKKFGLWRKGKAGATCDQTCNAIGRKCDSEMQSTIRSCEDIAAAASKAGVSCAHHSSCYGRTDRDISYAGAPFISAQSGLCYFLSDGAQSVCNSNAVSHHEPLCYCL